MASTHGSISSAVGKIWLTGVSRSGKGKAMPASPSVSGMPPRSEPTTGMPLIMASTATSPWVSHHSEGIKQDLGQTPEPPRIGRDRHDLDIGMVRRPQPARAQRLPGRPALDDQKRNIGPPPPQLLGDPHKRIRPLVQRGVDKRHDTAGRGRRPRTRSQSTGLGSAWQSRPSLSR